jgi:phenolic acid decarboxylase
MERITLQLIIQKYNLKGLIEQVKWKISNNELNVDFISPHGDLIGNIYKSNIELPNKNLLIYDTSQLNKLISVMSDMITIDTIDKLGKPFKLLVNDGRFNFTYSLSEEFLIPPVPAVTEPTYEIKIKLNTNDIISLMKAKSAVDNSNALTISPGLESITFSFGEDADHSNKLDYNMPYSDLTSNFKLTLNSDSLREILNANKECDINYLYISSEGLLKLEFNNDDLKSTYYLVSKEN